MFKKKIFTELKKQQKHLHILFYLLVYLLIKYHEISRLQICDMFSYFSEKKGQAILCESSPIGKPFFFRKSKKNSLKLCLLIPKFDALRVKKVKKLNLRQTTCTAYKTLYQTRSFQQKILALFFLTLVLLNMDIPCLCKQCRSRSVGF